MEHLGHKIKRIDQLFKIRMDHNLEQLDITVTQMRILIYLFHSHEEKITQKRLAEDFGVKHSTMSGILNRLKEKELIEIKVDEENKKYRNISVTKKAKQLDEQMILHRSETEALLLHGFSEKEIEELGSYLDRLYNNLLMDNEISDKDIDCYHKRIGTIERRHEHD